MDAPRKEPDVEPFIPPEIKEFAEILVSKLKCSVYLTGGALLPHDTQDYDLIVATTIDDTCLFTAVEALYRDTPGMQSLKIREAYSDNLNSWRMVCTLEYRGHKIDLLVLQPGQSIKGMLERYPLSIQKVAFLLAGDPPILGTNNYYIYHQDFTPASDNLIIVHAMGRALDKYQKYYPKSAFLLLPGIGATNDG